MTTGDSEIKNPFILGMGTANPERYITAKEFHEKIGAPFLIQEEYLKKTEEVYPKIGVEGRHFGRDYTLTKTSYPVRALQNIEQVNNEYIGFAMDISEKSCLKAVQDWGGNPKDITHFVTATCTGQMVPDLNARLIPILGLNDDINRVSSNFNGCCAGLTTMRIAADIARANKNFRLLVLCTELCTQQMSLSAEFDQVITSYLFGDGSAAYIMGSEPKESEKPLYEVLGSHTKIIPNTQNLLKFELAVQGWSMTIDPMIPPTISTNVQGFLNKMLEEKCNGNKLPTDLVAECEYLLHPGGPGILKGICKSLGITDYHARHSWHVLKKYGNMSSATVLFTMNSARYDKVAKPYSISFAFGPGLAVEGIVLKNHFINNTNI
ncbi:putative polyketide synthase [Tieghemostelium lacteum]|uniref:Putative polyketide synthase n=1 Tax=Tieghemostelium lacteum TaxID=361077 RepID=A0A151ZGJ1_TIELA|nr:putative polyketide synthase [Tieghemostelium lacteum]|eukprot:KYQ93091.1 putative polyketide synthase [Tieghemostelium lacteum]